MSIAFTAAVALQLKEEKRIENIKRRFLRDHSDPFSVSDISFINYYRINKTAFKMILDEVQQYVDWSSIPIPLQLAAVLRYFAVGGYQMTIAKDFEISFGRSTFAKIFSRMLPLLEDKVCEKWINLEISSEEKRRSHNHFNEKFRIPGIIGCVDGTHIRILKPVADESLYFNRKGYFSINAMVICDHNMVIKGIDGCRPGSSHDSMIWNLSILRNHFVQKYNSGERGSWLLGDSGYALEPFLITPYRNVSPRSPQHRFNKRHCKARNVIERTIGLLKSRFRCLLGKLMYKPKKVVKIINICCALHNICIHYKVPINVEIESNASESDSLNVFENIEPSDFLTEGSLIRDAITNI